VKQIKIGAIKIAILLFFWGTQVPNSQLSLGGWRVVLHLAGDLPISPENCIS
jgi:hypothetical protein